MRVTLIHNPTAGEEEHGAEALLALIAAAGHEVAYESVKEPDWQAALRDRADLVAIAGGDGTVRKVFKELAESAVAATLLPTGSANNVARTLGFDALDLERLVRGWASATRSRYDVGLISAPWGESRFVESIGGGVFADALARAEDSDVGADGEEKLETGLQLLQQTTEEAVARRWELDLDGLDLSGEYVAVEAMNIREIGPNIPLAPSADPGDGELDLVRIPSGNRAALQSFIRDRLDGRQPRPPLLPVQRGAQLEMRPPADCHLHLDDGLWPEDGGTAGGSAIVVTARASRLELLIPRSAHQPAKARAAHP